MIIKDLKIIYENSAILSISGKTFKEAVKTALTKKDEANEPLCFVFSSSKKILYFNRNLFQAFFDDQISLEELITETSITSLYRNHNEIKISGVSIDPGSLWGFKNQKLQLIDDDLFLESEINENFVQINLI